MNSHREVLVLSVGEGSVVDSVDDGSSVLERASLSSSVLREKKQGGRVNSKSGEEKREERRDEPFRSTIQC